LTSPLKLLGSVIPPGKKPAAEKTYYEYYILIGGAGLILLGVIAFILYVHFK